MIRGEVISDNYNFSTYIQQMCESVMKMRGRSLPKVTDIEGFVEGELYVFFHENPEVSIALGNSDSFIFTDATTETEKEFNVAHEPGPYPEFVAVICDAIERAEKAKIPEIGD